MRPMTASGLTGEKNHHIHIIDPLSDAGSEHELRVDIGRS